MSNGVKIAFVCVGLSLISYILLYGTISPEEQNIYNDIIGKFKQNELRVLSDQDLAILDKKKIDLKLSLYQVDSAARTIFNMARTIFNAALPYIPMSIPIFYILKDSAALSLVTTPSFAVIYILVNNKIEQNKIYKQKLQDELDFIDQIIDKMRQK